MFCNKCGTKLPDDSAFCTNCGATLDTKVSLAKDLPQVSVPQQRPQSMGMVCRACSKPLTTKWKKCPYCDAPNPFYIAPDPQPEKPAQPVQPQVIIQEREVIKKDDDSGCATLVGKIVFGIIDIIFLLWLLSQCSAG